MTPRLVLSVAYVLAVAALTAVAVSDEDHERWWAGVAAAALCLPTIYLGCAVAWTLTDGPSFGSASSTDPFVGDGPMWPVTLVVTAMVTAIAIVNVWVAWSLRARTTVHPDRSVLVSNLLSGALWLLLLVPWSEPAEPGGWLLVVSGAACIAGASVLLAAAYGRECVTRHQEAGSWVAAWLVPVAAWTVVSASMDNEDAPALASWGLAVCVGLVIGTGCFLVWQLVALAVRQLMWWRRTDASLRAAARGLARTPSGSSPAPAPPAPAGPSPRRPG